MLCFCLVTAENNCFDKIKNDIYDIRGKEFSNSLEESYIPKINEIKLGISHGIKSDVYYVLWNKDDKHRLLGSYQRPWPLFITSECMDDDLTIPHFDYVNRTYIEQLVSNNIINDPIHLAIIKKLDESYYFHEGLMERYEAKIDNILSLIDEMRLI